MVTVAMLALIGAETLIKPHQNLIYEFSEVAFMVVKDHAFYKANVFISMC